MITSYFTTVVSLDVMQPAIEQRERINSNKVLRIESGEDFTDQVAVHVR
jgi:hypothetical protein